MKSKSTAVTAIAASLYAALAALVLTMAACSADSPQKRIASGKAFVANKDYASAIIQFKGALQADPALVDARLLLGQALLDSGDAPAATIELTKALNAKAPASAVLPALSRAMVLGGESKRLTSTYGQTSIDDRPALAALKANLAMAWAIIGDEPASQAALAASLTAVPDFGPAQTLVAGKLAGQRKFDEALAMLDAVLAKDAKLVDAWQLQGEIQQFAKADLKSAEKSYLKALSVDSRYVPAHFALIASRLSQRDLEGAKSATDAMRKVLPNHPLLKLFDGQLAYLNGDFTRARELAQALLRVLPDNREVLILAGTSEKEVGSAVQAAAHFAKALRLNPSDNLARRNLAEVNVQLGQYAKALQALQPMLDAKPPSIDALAIAGDAEVRQGRPDVAEKYFRRAAQMDPANERLKIAAASTGLWRRDPSAAFSELASLSVKSTEIYAEQAVFSARMQRRQFDAALSALDAMEKKKPGTAAVQELRGQVHLARRDLPAARLSFEQALKLNPALFAAVTALASIDSLEGKPAQAVKRLQAALAADPGNSSAMIALANFKLTQNAPAAEIKKLLADAIAAAPASAEARVLLINYLVQQRQLKEALLLAQESAAAVPGDVRVLDSVGVAQLQAGAFEQALATFRMLVAAEPTSARPYMRMAEAHTAAGSRDQAEAAVGKALELEPGSASAQAAMIDLLMNANRQGAALTVLKRIQDRQPPSPLGYQLEAAFHVRTKKLDAAIDAYRKGLATVPSTDMAAGLYGLLQQTGRKAEAKSFGASWIKQNPRDSGFEFILSTSDIAEGSMGLAEERLKRVVAANPGNVMALNNLAWVLASNGRPEALAYARQAEALAPDSAAILDTLAFSLVAGKQFSEALAVQSRAVSLEPKDNRLRLNLADIAIKSGDKELARQELQRLKELGSVFPNQAEVARLLQTL